MALYTGCRLCRFHSRGSWRVLPGGATSKEPHGNGDRRPPRRNLSDDNSRNDSGGQRMSPIRVTVVSSL
ncbi:hypothetical protein IG631_08331 [Alternaria alternata]|nr:hypothetical protein IG631_08331 [Alternaria alternata]